MHVNNRVMVKHPLYLVWLVTGAVINQDELVSFLSVDLNCLRDHMTFFLSFINAVVDEVDGK